MHQIRKGNQFYFGMKALVGVDAESGLVHSTIGTADNIADVTQAHDLSHGAETVAFGDAGYAGVTTRGRQAGGRLARGDEPWQAAGAQQHGAGPAVRKDRAAEVYGS
jgi:IS5 family transposase